jgi:hypothetical protein
MRCSGPRVEITRRFPKFVKRSHVSFPTLGVHPSTFRTNVHFSVVLGVTDFGTTDDNVMPVTVERRTSAPLTRWHRPRNPMARKYRRRGAATYVNAARDRVDPAEAEQRLAERERREAVDTRRTEAQRWLNDPPPDRSALAAKR